MKKALAFLFAVIFVFIFSGCGIPFMAEKTISDSKIFRESEINNAMFAVYRHFALHFEGCVLLSIEYDEEYSKDRAKEWAERYDKDLAIVLLSDFYVYGETDGSLAPGETYRKWNWILVKDKGGFWELKDWGYG